jgi:hypothetical protein
MYEIPAPDPIDLRQDYDEMSPVAGGTLYLKGAIVQVWWDDGTEEHWALGLDAQIEYNRLKRQFAPEPTKQGGFDQQVFEVEDRREMGKRQYLTDDETVEIINYFHTAKTIYQERYDRLWLAAKWFHEKHPDITQTRAYKEVDYATRPDRHDPIPDSGILDSPDMDDSTSFERRQSKQEGMSVAPYIDLDEFRVLWVAAHGVPSTSEEEDFLKRGIRDFWDDYLTSGQNIQDYFKTISTEENYGPPLTNKEEYTLEQIHDFFFGKDPEKDPNIKRLENWAEDAGIAQGDEADEIMENMFLQTGQFYPGEDVKKRQGYQPPKQFLYYLNVYAVTQNYGGPEEGGWWYESGMPLASVPWVAPERLMNDEGFLLCVDGRLSFECQEPLILDKYRDEIDRKKVELKETFSHEKYGDTSSVLGGQDVRVVLEHEMAKPFPEERPHYE